jgi:RimJ/RimL family protein N-acetyltransferase
MIHLESFSGKDFGLLKTWAANQEELSQFAGTRFVYPLTDEQLLDYLNDPFVHAYKILDDESNNAIGHGEIYIAEDRIPKLCRIIIGDKSFRGKGLGIIIVNELLKLAFKITDSETAELNVYDWNTSAFKCYRNCGFIVNPQKQKTVFVNGKEWVSINMVISKKNFLSNL